MQTFEDGFEMYKRCSIAKYDGFNKRISFTCKMYCLEHVIKDDLRKYIVLSLRYIKHV